VLLWPFFAKLVNFGPDSVSRAYAQATSNHSDLFTLSCCPEWIT
jgi:hypothetical protein